MGVPIRPLAILILIVLTLATCSGSKNAAPVASTAANRPPEPVQLPTSSPVPPTTVSTPATTANRITTETPELIDGWTLRYPYPIPASCPVTPLQGPYKWIGFPAF